MCGMSRHIWLVHDFYTCFLTQKVTGHHAATEKLSQICLNLAFIFYLSLHQKPLHQNHQFYKVDQNFFHQNHQKKFLSHL